MSLVPYSKTFASRATRALPKSSAGMGKGIAAGLGLAGAATAAYAYHNNYTYKQRKNMNERAKTQAEIAAEKAKQEQFEKLVNAKATDYMGKEGGLYEILYGRIDKLPVEEFLSPPDLIMQVEAYALDRLRKEGEEAENRKRVAEGLKPNPVTADTTITKIDDVMTIINNYITYLDNKKDAVSRFFGRSYPNPDFNPAVLREIVSRKKTKAIQATQTKELRGGRRKRSRRSRRRRTHRK